MLWNRSWLFLPVILTPTTHLYLHVHLSCMTCSSYHMTLHWLSGWVDHPLCDKKFGGNMYKVDQRNILMIFKSVSPNKDFLSKMSLFSEIFLCTAWCFYWFFIYDSFSPFFQGIRGWYISLTIHWCGYRNIICTLHYLSLELCY